MVGGDNWSILRVFPTWLPPASVTFADDVFTTAMKKTPLPFRAYSPSSPDNPDPQSRAQINVLDVYPAAALMARGVPSLLGYHGMESQFFDALLGGKNIWQYQFSAEHLGPVRRQVLRDDAGAAAASGLSQDSRPDRARRSGRQ